jgi:hypothetical protein
MNKVLLRRIHFSLLLFLLINFLIRLIVGVSIEARIVLVGKVLLYLSALCLLGLSIRHMSRLTVYYSLYILYPLSCVLSWLADGILGALISSLFFYLLIPPTVVQKQRHYELREEFTGLLGGCCSYSIYQNHGYLFESRLAEFRNTNYPEDWIDFRVNEHTREAVLRFKREEMPDSVLIVKLH